MAEVRVRPVSGPDRVFEIDERLYTAFPDDYVLVEESSPSGYRPRTAASAAPTTPVIGGTAEEGAN